MLKLSQQQADDWKFLETFHKSCSFYHLVEKGFEEIKTNKPLTTLKQLKAISEKLSRNQEELIAHYDKKEKGIDCKCVYCTGKSSISLRQDDQIQI